MREAIPWVLALVLGALLVRVAFLHARELLAFRRACWLLAELEAMVEPPTYNHTRADGPYDPCPECALRAALLARLRVAQSEGLLDKKAGNGRKKATLSN